MDVIIVSKTRMSNAVCVGGVLANGRFVRLLDKNGHNQDIDTDFKIGDVYTMTFQERTNIRPPHTEDILVDSAQYKFTFESIAKMVSYLTHKLNVNIWRGGISSLFDRNLLWTSSGSGYISANGQIPMQSTGFWLPDKDLRRSDYGDKVRYSYPLTPILNSGDDLLGLVVQSRYISFVGLQEPVDIIPANTLVRVSLARWWQRPDSVDEERCYLQLSGWYLG